MVDRAAERMRDRYAEIVSGQDVSDEVRHVATRIKERIETAHRTFTSDAQMATGGNKQPAIVMDDEVEVLLTEGTFIHRGQAVGSGRLGSHSRSQ